MTPVDYSWSVGAANSRVIRVLFYLAEGLVSGALLYLVVSLAILVFGIGLGSFGILGIFLLLSVRWVWFLRALHRGESEIAWEIEEWITVRRWPLTFLLVGPVSGILIYSHLRYPWWFLVNSRLVVFALLVIGFVCAFVARFLSSRGELDSETLTLSYNGRRDVDLQFITDIKRFTVGAWTVLWLSAPRGYENRRELQGFYAIPSETLKQAWPVFKDGMNTETETPAGYRPSRTMIYAGILLFGGTGITVFVMLLLAGISLWFAGYIALATFGLIGVIALASVRGLI